MTASYPTMSATENKAIEAIAAAMCMAVLIGIAIAAAMITYDAIAKASAWRKAEAADFYLQCKKELIANTYPRVVADHIENICGYAAIGIADKAPHEYTNAIKATLRPEAPEQHLETKYFNQQERHIPPTWDPLGVHYISGRQN